MISSSLSTSLPEACEMEKYFRSVGYRKRDSLFVFSEPERELAAQLVYAERV
jgi:hypothetical protein